jgi:hypothetical protein
MPRSSVLKDKPFACLYVSGEARFSARKHPPRRYLGSISRVGGGIDERYGDRPECHVFLFRRIRAVHSYEQQVGISVS